MNIKVNFLLSAKHHNTERNQEKQSKKNPNLCISVEYNGME
jgi:hypothetical protein